MPRRHHLLVALSGAGFRRLYGVRLSSQFGDGVFQATLAGTVLFNPERQTSAAAIAAGFAVLLLPYSVIEPFAGVLLDRWSRQRVLMVANIVRAVAILGFAAETASGVNGPAFYASALVLVSIGRFILSALSASLPRVVPLGELVTANALSTTSGTITAAAGGGVAIGLRELIGGGNGGYALVAALAALPYLLGATFAAGFPRGALGPSEHERTTHESAGAVLAGLVAGARHVHSHPAVLRGLCVIGAHRLGYGVTTVCTVLLYRNYFDSSGVFRSGLAGLSQVVSVLAIGGGLAAFVTPVAFRHIGPVNWPTTLLIASAAFEVGLVLPYSLPLLLLGVFALAFAAQSIKISVDTLVQQQVSDEFRGRVFALYDTLFNVTLVLAAVLTATVLPDDGHSPASVLVIAAGYLLTALAYAMSAARAGRLSPRVASTTP